MKKMRASAVHAPNLGVARDFRVGAAPAYGASATHAAAPWAAAAQRIRRTAAATAASVDGGVI